jgi:RimJ/RimL family protein N-acetyltransferase
MTPHGTRIPVIESARLVLRGPRDTDAAPLAAVLQSPRAEWIGGPCPDDDAAEWLDGQRGQWADFGRARTERRRMEVPRTIPEKRV